MDAYMENCCRICLVVANTMLSTDEQIENFNKTINELIMDCCNFERSKTIKYPKLICEECASELLVVVKFREKCKKTEKILERWRNKHHGANNSVAEKFKFEEATSNVTGINEVTKNPVLVCRNSRTVSKQNLAVVKEESVYENVEYVHDETEHVEYVFIQNDGNNLENLILQVNQNEVDEEEEEEDFLSQSQNEFDGNHQVIEQYDVGDDIIMESTEDDAGQSNQQQINEQPAQNGQEITHKPSKKRNRKNTRNAYKETIINHKCKICGAGFTHLNNLVRHRQTHNDDGTNDTENINASNDFAEDESSQPSDERIKSKNTLSKKVAKDRKNCLKECGCEYCGKSFTSPSLLAAHTRIHTGERPYQCFLCEKAFKTRGGLDLHSRRHSGDKPFKCSVCNRGFVESSNLKVHMRTHTGEKPHQCTTCGRGFSRVFLLQLHQRTHTGERPYSCDLCEKSFAQLCDLTAHKRIHTGERPHICTICKKGFIKGSALTQHLRRHTNLKNVKTDIIDHSIQRKAHNSDAIEDEQIIVCYETDDTIKEYLIKESSE